MEVPYNTTLVKEMRIHGQNVAPVADWQTKRDWVDYAFAELEKAGYTVASAYAAVKDPSRTKFLYRDLLWTGADMIGLGVASFSHVGGTHFQNRHDFDPYIASIENGELPIFRALTPTQDERLIRELILQMKLGHVHRAYFQTKFGIDVEQRFAAPLANLRDHGLIKTDRDGLRLSRQGLLQVDKLLHEFFLPEHRSARYA
jgi:oxygen-independent coproporphyrinogen-3 oxidase